MINHFASSFKDGDSISISNFEGETVNGETRTIKHAYRIVFVPTTVVNPITPVDYYSSDDVHYELSDVNFCDIKNGLLDKRYLVGKFVFCKFNKSY